MQIENKNTKDWNSSNTSVNKDVEEWSQLFFGTSIWARCVSDLRKHGGGKCQLLGSVYFGEGEFGKRVGVEKGEQQGAHPYLSYFISLKVEAKVPNARIC